MCLDTAQNLNKALNRNLILIELTEFRLDLSTCNSLLDGLHQITGANLTALMTSGFLRESTMAKRVITIANSLRNVRITCSSSHRDRQCCRDLSLSHTMQTNASLNTVHQRKRFLALHVFSTYLANFTCFASLPCIEFRPNP